MNTVQEKVVFGDRARLRDGIRYEEKPSGIVTSISLGAGQHHVLSRYEDHCWRLPDTWFTSNVKAYERKLEFTRIVSERLRNEAKVVMLRSIWGRDDESKRFSGGTIRMKFTDLVLWLNWLSAENIHSQAKVSPFVAQRYLDYLKALRIKRKGKFQPLASKTVFNRLLAVELCWETLRDTAYQFTHPWPDASATSLSGKKRLNTSKTLVIPDSILVPLFKYAESQLKRADELLGHSEAVRIYTPESTYRIAQNAEKNRLLMRRGWQKGLRKLSKDVTALRDCCFLIIMVTTGIRAHELANIRRGNWYCEERDGELFYFIGSRSDKTNAGETSWLCPEIAIEAVKALERLSAPIQIALEEALLQSKIDGDHEETTRLAQISGHVSLVKVNLKNNRINVLSGNGLLARLECVTKRLNLDWHLAPHQFRRTFAHYVVHHKLGDLRYLRDHFKHWSLDMAALYAMNEAQDLELYDEIYAAFDEKRQAIIGHWLEPDTRLSGGLAPYVRQMREREQKVRTYKSRREMVKSMSDLIMLRSTGIAWCTNDDGACGGGQCEECEHGCIDDTFQAFWEGVYLQQIELLQIDDIGESGSATIKRTIKRCEQVLGDLGANIDEIKARRAAFESS